MAYFGPEVTFEELIRHEAIQGNHALIVVFVSDPKDKTQPVKLRISGRESDGTILHCTIDGDAVVKKRYANNSY